MNPERRHLLDLASLDAPAIEALLDLAESFAAISHRPIKKVPTLRGRTIVNLFLEPSTRTRTSFELAAKRLSADTLTISGTGSSVTKGETLLDTAHNLAAWQPDIIVLRHHQAGAPHLLARRIDASIVNAGDGAHEHPTQALLDALTLTDRLGSLEGRTIAIIGDIAHSRVARSNLFLLKKLGARVLLGGPRSLVPRTLEALGGQIVRDVDEIIEVADAVMMLRVQFERLVGPPPFPSLSDYTRAFGLTAARAKRMKPEAFVMHPGPMNRGIEIDPEVADGPTSVVAHQVRNGIAARMAVLERAMKRGPWAKLKDGTAPRRAEVRS